MLTPYEAGQRAHREAKQRQQQQVATVRITVLGLALGALALLPYLIAGSPDKVALGAMMVSSTLALLACQRWDLEILGSFLVYGVAVSGTYLILLATHRLEGDDLTKLAGLMLTLVAMSVAYLLGWTRGIPR